MSHQDDLTLLCCSVYISTDIYADVLGYLSGCTFNSNVCISGVRARVSRVSEFRLMCTHVHADRRVCVHARVRIREPRNNTRATQAGRERAHRRPSSTVCVLYLAYGRSYKPRSRLIGYESQHTRGIHLAVHYPNENVYRLDLT